MNKKTDLFGVILAGGSGSRLWPLSREMHPKQLLRLHNKKTLFQSTFLRLTEIINNSNILTVTNIKHSQDIRIQLDEIEESLDKAGDLKIIVEPLGRNTAPAIGLAALYILKKMVQENNDPVIFVAPSDHMVQCQDEFAHAIDSGYELAKKGYIVTFGIKPESPDTGFGYIKAVKDEDISSALKVQEFREKPDLATAEEYCRQGNYFWNSGIFMFQSSTLLNELEKYSNEIFKNLINCELQDNEPTVKFVDYEQMPDISIDYAVMEHSKLIALIPIDCGWNDMGSWQSIFDMADKDEKNNFISGNVIDIDSEDSLIYGTSKLISTIGLKDTVIIETEDAILACDKNRTQDVKKVFEHLKENNDLACIVHKTVYKPWGYSTTLQKGEGFVIKTIHINPKAGLSLQVHQNRSEHWVVLEGNARIIKDEEEIYLKPGESIDIPATVKHSLDNITGEGLKIIEVQTGSQLEDEDITRFEGKCTCRE